MAVVRDEAVRSDAVEQAGELMREGRRDDARRELVDAFGSELVADFALAGLGSAFPAFTAALERFGPDEHEAAGNLGLWLHYRHAEAGDEVTAQVILELLIEHGHPDVAARAMVPRAVHFARFGDHERAEDLFTRAMDSGDAACFALAGFCMGERREERGDEDGAIAVYRRVLDAGDGQVLAGAGGRLGDLLADRGDAEGARAAYERAALIDHPDGGQAAIWLMQMLLGDLSEDEVRAATEAAHRTIATSPRPEAVAFACNLIGMAAKDAGDADEARRWLSRAADMDQPISEFASEALAELPH
ncbi:hypothetical protein GCM10010191_16140 [Actinomadura vinacea]|uniref:Tetratricopeptide repeat protein n=1 Tax=Actinomadura vinacea TaxID=115336 RepID=A0ABN3INQ1_9ACTN